MKKTLTTAILTLGTVFGFAQEAIQEPAINTGALPLEVKPSLPIEEKVLVKKSFTYLRMGVSDSQPVNTIDSVKVVPGLGIGYRLLSGASAFDVSASYNLRYTTSGEERQETYFYTLPKANYLYYTSPARNNSFYVGGGAAWGGLKTKDNREFMGLIPNAAVGYEINRKATVRTFIQLDVSQPAIAAVKDGLFPGPFAELSVGAGF